MGLSDIRTYPPPLSLVTISETHADPAPAASMESDLLTRRKMPRCLTNYPGTNPVCGLMMLLLLLCGLNARAGTLTVSSLADSGTGTLRDQVAAAAAGDTIVFNVTGNITLTSDEIAINKDLNIIGPGASNLVVSLSSGYSTSIFSLSNSIVGLSGLTLSNGPGTAMWVEVNNTNTWINFGGAIYMTGGTVTIAGTTFVNNRAAYGGAIYMTGGTLAVTGCTLAHNFASYPGLGGAIYAEGGALTVSNSTISTNSAITGGGIANLGEAMIVDSAILGNTTSSFEYGYGAGIYCQGTTTIKNSTISGNRSLGDSGVEPVAGGGGVYNLFSQNLTIANSTIAGNLAEYGGGIRNDGTMYISNTIVASNTASGSPDMFGGSTGDYNLVQNGTSPSGAHNITGQPAFLGPLQNNGGPTLTYTLLRNSPALEAGDPNFDLTDTPYDQRGPGFPRIKDRRVCIGAFESELPQSGSNIVVNMLDDHDDGIAGPVDCTLREAVNYAPAGATITFSVAGLITLTNGAGELVISNNLSIIGPANAPGITVSGNNASRIFRVTQGTNVVAVTANLSTLTLSGGNGAGSVNSGLGGALCVDTVTPLTIVTMTNCTFSGNRANNSGAIRNGGTMTVSGSTFSGNRATNNGGAIQSVLGTLTVMNSTFSGNSATGTGTNGVAGAIRSGGNLTVTSCTFFGNSATFSGGAIDISTGGAPSISNTIVAGNTAPTGPDLNGIVTSGDYNLVQNPAGATLPGTHNITGQPAALGPLANNGGPTQTHALLSSSPAIDRGATTLTTDQRGVSRPQGLADDIGAYELPYLLALSIQALPLSQVQISWNTVTNSWYQLQYSSTLATNQWSPLTAWIGGGGQIIWTNDPVPVSGPPRFYRVAVTNSP